MFDINHYAKWFYIAWGLLLLVGITGWFSGGKNGNVIFTDSITIIFVIMLIAFIALKLPEIRHGREKVYQMRNEEFERECQLIKRESDLWTSLSREQRKDWCGRLGLASRYSKLSLIHIPIKDRKILVYVLNVEFAQKDEKDRKYASSSWDSVSGQPTYYEMLGIDRNASENEINNAFRKKILAWHPDKRKDIGDAGEYAKILNEIKETLLDKEKRRQYDATLG
jgi:hypothetical protein